MSFYGLRFRTLGQTTYHAGPDGLHPGDLVIIPAEQGETLAEVVSGPHATLPAAYAVPDQDILRQASADDVAQSRHNEALAHEAAAFCRRCIRQRRLDMKLVDVEVYFDRSKLIFYFTAPARIDFRELVKDLVREYRARIELRQIGVRHETQMVGAVGNCGMVCCCRRYLRKFAPVTIRMAKEQNLFLNPAKISGICGRLLCCLAYEQENYDHFHHNCPRLGKKYQTNQGTMKVLRANMFRNSLSVLNEHNEEMELTLDQWQALDPHRPEAPQQGGQPAQPKPRPQPAGDSMLVVSATPDTIDDPSLFDALLADGMPEATPPQAASRPQQNAPHTPSPAPEGEGGKNRRKRRRKPTNREDGHATDTAKE
ncbi:regulatory iron-sulfur-containing complex subunit RicT [uncultured Desulfovibrio sp.]|uniref:PSP1 domain-containing protein n=1 Tax=uncultured Desulfovibrio sp. TaxID=167968 RepID=UPI00261B265D|nr:regulatory iron-sulfur-containing complex subunit RicT [uncultured Desulfovibrio sp.]